MLVLAVSVILMVLKDSLIFLVAFSFFFLIFVVLLKVYFLFFWFMVLAEHMLFYASEKYPLEDSYSKYIIEVINYLIIILIAYLRKKSFFPVFFILLCDSGRLNCNFGENLCCWTMFSLYFVVYSMRSMGAVPMLLRRRTIPTIILMLTVIVLKMLWTGIKWMLSYFYSL